MWTTCGERRGREWLAGQGVDHEDAITYVKHIFGQLGQSLSQHTGSLTALTEKHMTPDGLNEQLMADLRRDGMPGLVRQALDRVLAHLNG